MCVCVCLGGGGGAATLHDSHAGRESGLCSVPLVGLQRQEIPGRTGAPGRPAAGGAHTYANISHFCDFFSRLQGSAVFSLQENFPSLTLTLSGWRRSPTGASVSQATRYQLHLHPAAAGSHSTGGFYCLCCVLQVQYSVIDQRPAAKMEQFCLANDIKLLTYGTLGKIQHHYFITLWSFELDAYKKSPY